MENSWRPNIVGRQHAVSTGHYLATEAAMRVLAAGGNAIDAGVTASMALAVLQPDIVSFAGVAPTLIYLKEQERVVSLAGLGYWPASTDVARLIAAGGDSVPSGLLRTVMPAAPATHLEALSRFGTISFAEAAAAACNIAREGFAVYPAVANNIAKFSTHYDRYPDNQRIFKPAGRPPHLGEPFRQEDLARTIAAMIDAETAATGDRKTRLRKVRDYFYAGPVAGAIADYHAANGGFMTRADLAGFEVPVEDSIRCTYNDLEVHACDVWCQGIVLLEALKILESAGLDRLEHNSVPYIHTVTEALNLAFADREAYVGDPKFHKVPTATLLSSQYAMKQRARIQAGRAFGKMPAPGAIDGKKKPVAEGAVSSGATEDSLDTIYCAVVDRRGNAYSATLSDNARDTPIIPGTGLTISSRGCQSRLQVGHPSDVRPGKRPRLTPSPGLVFRDGRFEMAYGTPGGDVQCQAMLQTLLNMHLFKMPVQQAIEAPRFASLSFPNSFAPHTYLPGRLCVEGRLPGATVDALRALGHDVELWPDLTARAGAISAVRRDPASGWLHAGADPRRESYAAAW